MADVGRLSAPRRQAITEGIIDGLRKLESIPSPGETSLFKPTNTLIELCCRRYAYSVPGQAQLTTTEVKMRSTTR